MHARRGFRTRNRRRADDGTWRVQARVERFAEPALLLLLVGWLRSRLRRSIDLVHKQAKTIRRLALDGERVAAPAGGGLSASDLLSEQLDLFERDPVYESAVKRAAE